MTALRSATYRVTYYLCPLGLTIKNVVFQKSILTLVVFAAADDLLHGGSDKYSLPSVSALACVRLECVVVLLLRVSRKDGTRTYVLILSGVRALLITQGRVRLDNVVLHQAVEL